jgi:glucose-1-phosphate adenylyltransferase
VFADQHDHRVGSAVDSIVGSGTIISGGQVDRSVIFNNVRVNSFSRVSDSILFPGVNVGRNARLSRCIIDKGVRIPAGEVIGEDPEADSKRFTVSEGGVVVVTRQDVGQRDEFDVD